jgi:type IV pilus assembly protein PilP
LGSGITYTVLLSTGDTNSIKSFNKPQECGSSHDTLQNYSLGTLKLVGTRVIKSQLIAIIKLPNSNSGMILTKEGDCMGKNRGKIIRITDSEIEVLEIVPESSGRWTEKKTVLSVLK